MFFISADGFKCLVEEEMGGWKEQSRVPGREAEREGTEREGGEGGGGKEGWALPDGTRDAVSSLERGRGMRGRVATV